MRILLLGGTGSIGAPLLQELLLRGHDVLALARAPGSAQTLKAAGARVLAGDLRAPERWVATLPDVDALIHVAATFDADEERVERRLLDALLPRLSRMQSPARFLYTGGCWLFGATDGTVATEHSPFAPLASFAWSVEQMKKVLEAPGIDAVIVHPAMVYGPRSGVFARFLAEARGPGPVRVVGGEHVRWPLVHSEDLAVLYRLALERAPRGESYLGSAIDGIAVGAIARAFIRRLRGSEDTPEAMTPAQAVAEFGPWAEGYGLDQLQSGAKARRELDWRPTHVDPLAEIAAWPLVGE